MQGGRVPDKKPEDKVQASWASCFIKHYHLNAIIVGGFLFGWLVGWFFFFAKKKILSFSLVRCNVAIPHYHYLAYKLVGVTCTKQ